MSLHHKFSLLYYLLLDFDDSRGRSQPSDKFSATSGMPKNYQILMKGLWHLDNQEFPVCAPTTLPSQENRRLIRSLKESLEYIAHPSLTPDFSDEILSALVLHAGDSLALSYYYTVRPVINSSAALELLFDAMARTDATEALLFSRTQPEYTREVLFQRLLSVTLGDKQNDHSSELAFLPFEGDEDAWFEEYLTNGDGRTLKRAKDTLLVRKIAGDRFDEISQLRSSGQWGPVLEGIRAGTEGRTE